MTAPTTETHPCAICPSGRSAYGLDAVTAPSGAAALHRWLPRRRGSPRLGWPGRYVPPDSNEYSVRPGAIVRRIDAVADHNRVGVSTGEKTVADHGRVWASHQILTYAPTSRRPRRCAAPRSGAVIGHPRRI